MLHAIVAATALSLTGPQVGAPAPDFHLTTLEGRPVSLADYRGKTLVINTWATWCSPCREETPDLIFSAKRLAASRDVAFLGIDSTEEAPIVRAFVASKQLPYPQAIDADKAFEKAYDIRAFPTTYVIDGAGIVRARYVGNISPQILAGFVDHPVKRLLLVEDNEVERKSIMELIGNHDVETTAVGSAAKAAKRCGFLPITACRRSLTRRAKATAVSAGSFCVDGAPCESTWMSIPASSISLSRSAPRS